MSTEEAEVFSGNEGGRSILWLTNLLNELNMKYQKPVMYEDCNNAIIWNNERKTTMRTRHLFSFQFVPIFFPYITLSSSCNHHLLNDFPLSPVH
jgi:hypothetical protein